MPTYIALMRGLNVGGSNRLAMRDLRAVFERAGGLNVSTYIQSGNVLFQATSADYAKNLAMSVSKTVEKEFRIQSPVIVRTAKQMKLVARIKPFGESESANAATHVAFLEVKPSAQTVAAIDSRRAPGDSIAVLGREVYLHLPRGVARTRFSSAYLDKLFGIHTTRNWRTVGKLAAMSSA